MYLFVCLFFCNFPICFRKFPSSYSFEVIKMNFRTVINSEINARLLWKLEKMNKNCFLHDNLYRNT